MQMIMNIKNMKIISFYNVFIADINIKNKTKLYTYYNTYLRITFMTNIPFYFSDIYRILKYLKLD